MKVKELAAYICQEGYTSSIQLKEAEYDIDWCLVELAHGYRELQSKIKQLTHALEIYADPANWENVVRLVENKAGGQPTFKPVRGQQIAKSYLKVAASIGRGHD